MLNPNTTVSASLRILQWSLARSLDVSDGLWEIPKESTHFSQRPLCPIKTHYILQTLSMLSELVYESSLTIFTLWWLLIHLLALWRSYMQSCTHTCARPYARTFPRIFTPLSLLCMSTKPKVSFAPDWVRQARNLALGLQQSRASLNLFVCMQTKVSPHDFTPVYAK